MGRQRRRQPAVHVCRPLKRALLIIGCAAAIVALILLQESAPSPAPSNDDPTAEPAEEARPVASPPQVKEDEEDEASEPNPPELGELEIQSQLDQLAGEELNRATVENLTQRWAELHFDAAKTWVTAQSPGPIRDQLIQRLAFVQAKTSPAEAARLAVEQIPPGPMQAEAVLAVLHQWALKDSPAALNWVERFPESSLKEAALSELNGVAATSPQ